MKKLLVMLIVFISCLGYSVTPSSTQLPKQTVTTSKDLYSLCIDSDKSEEYCFLYVVGFKGYYDTKNYEDILNFIDHHKDMIEQVSDTDMAKKLYLFKNMLYDDKTTDDDISNICRVSGIITVLYRVGMKHKIISVEDARRWANYACDNGESYFNLSMFGLDSSLFLAKQ